jgi:hypothetical protein
MVDESHWVSIATALEIAGCSEPTVLRAIRLGQVRQRTGLPRGVPSLERASVEEWAAQWQRERAVARSASRGLVTAPPDDGHEWLKTKDAALIVGRSPTWLVDRAKRGLAPHARRGNRLWWRRDQVEAMGAVRAPR